MPENRSQEKPSMAVRENVEKAKRETSSSSVTSYPSGLTRGIALSFSKYKFPGGDRVGAISRSSVTGSTNSIVLPLPRNGLVESTDVQNNATQLGLGGAGAASIAGIAGDPNAAYDAGSATAKALKDVFGSLGDMIFGVDSTDPREKGFNAAGSQFIVKAAARQASGLAGQGIQSGIDVGTGSAVNNFSTIAFNDVNLRNYNFSWTFLPESPGEVEKIIDIKRKLQKFSLPSYSANNPANSGLISRVLFEYPHICNAALFGVDENAFFSFKPALVKQVQMSYRGPDESVAFLKGGKPAMMVLSIQFEEIAIWTAEDY